MRRWRIYYDDGATFDWTQGPPEAAPSFGVLAIVQDPDPDDPHAPGREIVDRFNWYYWAADEGCWYGGDLSGVLDRMLHRLPVEALCQGRTCRTLFFREILARVAADPDFPKVRAAR